MYSDGTCFTDGPGNYGRYERCSVVALQNVMVTASEYSVTVGDYLTIYPVGGPSTGYRYQASANAPNNVPLPAGSTITWQADRSGYAGGFTLCATTAPSPPPTSPPYPPGGAPAPPPPLTPGTLWRIESTSVATTMAGPVESCYTTNGVG